MPKSGEFEDGKKRLEAQVDAVAKTLDEIQVRLHRCATPTTSPPRCQQLYGKTGGPAAKPISEADLMTFAKRSDDRTQQLIGIRHYRRLLCEGHRSCVRSRLYE